jgi:site-specific DNA recombinase
MRAVIYARYSTDLQNQASIEDQVRLCRERIEREGWSFYGVYEDRGVSGASHLRAGYQRLIANARACAFDVVVAEALDRLSRDQEHVAGLFKQLSFAGVRMVTLSEGEISELHVGLKGTMNALFLKDLADKTRRGLRGRIEAGKSGGGIAYGYRVVRAFDAAGEPVRGDRTIDPGEAAVVERIFREYAGGRSPRVIAQALNKEGVPGPDGKAWGPSTIYGNWRRGTGVLNNELYIGVLVWNRQRFVKDPTTGKRQARLNPPEAWIREAVPDLRIVGEALWQAVKARQLVMREEAFGAGVTPCKARRPRTLLSGLVKCGCCGGGYVVISRDHMGCATARDRGTCTNRLTIRIDVLERSVLAGLQTELMRDELVALFIAEFKAELDRITAGSNAGMETARREIATVERQIRAIIEAVKQGFASSTLREELGMLERRKAELSRSAARPAPVPVLHPNLAELYRRKVAGLREALSDEATREEAADVLRSLVAEVRLVPVDGVLTIRLRGELAAMLEAANEKPRREAGSVDLQTKLVAGARSPRGLTLPGVAV